MDAQKRNLFARVQRMGLGLLGPIAPACTGFAGPGCAPPQKGGLREPMGVTLNTDPGEGLGSSSSSQPLPLTFGLIEDERRLHNGNKHARQPPAAIARLPPTRH